MQKYSLGFIFNSNLQKVLLMHKLRPQWQNGLINGLGGKCEPEEKIEDCIVREIKEESGVHIERNKWINAGDIYGPDWIATIFTTIYRGNTSDMKTMEEEKIEWFDIDALPGNTIANVPWLISLCLDMIKNKRIKRFNVEYLK